MESLIFNPEYHLRQDGNRVILYSNEEVSDNSEVWFSFINPLQAMMLSFFDGRSSYTDEVENCSKFFNLKFEKMNEIVARFMDRAQWFTIKSGSDWINFPRNVLLGVNVNGMNRTDYPTANDFRYDGKPDFQTVRLKYPIDLNLELTMKCYANCVYCYANRSLKDKTLMTLQEVKNIIRQAKANGVAKIDINGGDVLLHPHIKEILYELVSNGYSPLVSTKTILKKEMIDYIISLKRVRLQISLDSANPATLHSMIGVPNNYINQMADILSYLTNRGFHTQINVVLTKFNASTGEIGRLLDYVSQFDAVKSVRFNPCGFSLYKEDFKELIVSASEMERIRAHVYKIGKNYPNLKIDFSSFDNKNDYEPCVRKYKFGDRALCTGGTRAAVILPNGDMTICEELYDHPSFILGNVRSHTIEDVWNSPKALALYNTPISSESSSGCKTCNSQSECRRGIGVCWKLVLMAYGFKHWDYPDPRCPHAPELLNDFCYE